LPESSSTISEREGECHNDNSRQLNFAYKIIHHKTDLFFGIDKELDNLSAKRNRKSPTHLTGIGNTFYTALIEI
jgi:hypothetical protein